MTEIQALSHINQVNDFRKRFSVFWESEKEKFNYLSTNELAEQEIKSWNKFSEDCGIKQMNYREQLLNPLWKHKSEQIKSRDGNACVDCGSSQRLEVHHCYYVAKRMAWDYPDDSLITLCRECHQIRTNSQNLHLNWESAACAVIRAVRTTMISNRVK